VEYWLHGFPMPRQTAALAADAEAQGFDGLMLADSPVLVGDPWIELAVAAHATSRLRLGVAVTNPIIRHPAVIASATATLQIESGGRALLVIGRGDSAVLQLGIRPAATAQLARAVAEIKAFLRGDDVPTVGGEAARMRWIAPYAPAEVPVSVAATGPATIALGAREAGRVDLTVGADPDRVGWAIAEARRAVAADGKPPSVGAFVNVAVHPDVRVARDLVRGSAAIFAHFVSQGSAELLPAQDRAVVEQLGRAYQEQSHGLRTASHSATLPDAFLDRFAVVGPAAECADRLRRLGDLGLDRIIVVPASRDADRELVAASSRRFAEEVLPGLRRHGSGSVSRG
jgi:5,10-methylenetetrahydromethanopterin reductase